MGPTCAEGAGMVTRLKHRLFPARIGGNSLGGSPTAVAPPASRSVRFRAGIAEFLLITRLKARSQPKLSADILERASHVVFVTSKNWFVAPDGQAVRRCTPL